MSRVVVQLALAAGMPRPLNGRCPSLFGVWLRERIASIAIDWPAVAFHRIELLADGVRLLLLARAATPPDVVGLAIARAVRLEVQSAALACCGLQRGTIWDDATVVIVEEVSNGAVSHEPWAPNRRLGENLGCVAESAVRGSRPMAHGLSTTAPSQAKSALTRETLRSSTTPRESARASPCRRSPS